MSTPDTRHKDVNWILPTDSKGAIQSWNHVEIAVLMDIRDELKRLNNLLYCDNFTGIPHTLSEIRRFTGRIKPSTTRKQNKKK